MMKSISPSTWAALSLANYNLALKLRRLILHFTMAVPIPILVTKHAKAILGEFFLLPNIIKPKLAKPNLKAMVRAIAVFASRDLEIFESVQITAH